MESDRDLCDLRHTGIGFRVRRSALNASPNVTASVAKKVELEGQYAVPRITRDRLFTAIDARMGLAERAADWLVGPSDATQSETTLARTTATMPG
jgi:hypothetical protein